MSLTREEVLAEIDRLLADSKPQPGDIFISDLTERGMGAKAALAYLESKVEQKELRMVKVVRNGKQCNAYRPVG